MSFNPLKLMQLKTAWQSFAMRHPKFPLFWKTAYAGQNHIRETSFFLLKLFQFFLNLNFL